MSSGWERDDWRLDEARSRRLPQIEDLPQTGDGYDRAAVEAAFESFYRHAAEVDRTLEVLESVAAFQRESGALRADIRALRAASWGPVPTLRHTVATTAVGRRERQGSGLEAWPRIALYSAFIIFVAVGAAVAELSSGAIVALVLASWLVVGLAELAVSGIGGRIGRARGYPEWAAEDRPEEAQAVAVEPPVVEVVEPEPEAAVEVVEEPAAEEELEAEEEPEPATPSAWRPWGRPETPADEIEAEPEPEPVADVEPQPEPEPEPEPVAEVEAEPEPEPEPVAEVQHEPGLVAEHQPVVPEVEPFGAPPEAPVEAGPVQVVPQVEPFEAAAAEAEPKAEPEPEEVAEPEPEPVPAVEPERGRRLRFWRRRPIEEEAALEPLPEPRHVRLAEVDEPEPAEAEAVPQAEADQAEAEPQAEAVAEAEPEPEPEPDEDLQDTDERPAVAITPASPSALRLRRGRR